VETPETRYAVTSDGVHIAYQVSGTGGVDVLWSGVALPCRDLVGTSSWPDR